MAAVFVKSLGTLGNEVSSTTAVFTLADAVAVGDVIAVFAAADNAGAAGASPFSSVTDSKTNVYNAFATNRTAASVANDGVTSIRAFAKVGVALVPGDTITITFTVAVVAKAAIFTHWRGLSNQIAISQSASGSSTLPSATGTVNSTYAVGSAVMGSVAVEGGSGDAITADADTSLGTWSTIIRASSGNLTTSSVTINFQYKIINANNANPQYNPTLGVARDWAANVSNFQPAYEQHINQGPQTSSKINTPDHVDFDIPGDHDLRFFSSPTVWTNAATLIARKDAGSANRFIEWGIVSTSGLVFLSWTQGGVMVTRTSTVAPSTVSVNGRSLWLGVTLDVDNGAGGHDVKFWYWFPTSFGSIDPPADITTWTQLGATVTTAGVASVDTGTGVYILGERDNVNSSQFPGMIYKAQLRNGINGSIVFNPDFTSNGDGWVVGDALGANHADSTGKVWTSQGVSGTAPFIMGAPGVRPLAGAPAAVSTVTGTIQFKQLLAGVSAGVTTVAGDVKVLHTLAGVIAGVGTAAGSMAVRVDVAGVSAGSSTVAGDLGLIIPLAGSSAGVSTAAGDVNVAIGLEGTSDGVSTVAGALDVAMGGMFLGGTSYGVGNAFGDLSVAHSLAGVADGVSTASGAVDMIIGLSGIAAGISDGTGTMKMSVSLAGVSDGVSTANGLLNALFQLAGLTGGVGIPHGSLGVRAPVFTFQPPIVYDASPISHSDSDRPINQSFEDWLIAKKLFRHFKSRARGRTVLKVDGEYYIVDTPTEEELAVAEAAYLGGHVYVVDSATKDELQAAGFEVIQS